MKCIVIKISGESLSDFKNLIVENEILKHTNDFDYLISEKYKIILIVGGGNIIRGRNSKYAKAQIDKAGMLSTMINGIMIKEILKAKYNVGLCSNVSCQLINTNTLLESVNLFDVTIVIGGSGKVGFSTDIAMILCAIETNANYVFKLTHVPGVYNKDKSGIYRKVAIRTVLNDDLLVIDRTAAALAADNNIDFYILHMNSSIKNAIESSFENYGTHISINLSDESNILDKIESSRCTEIS